MLSMCDVYKLQTSLIRKIRKKWKKTGLNAGKTEEELVGIFQMTDLSYEETKMMEWFQSFRTAYVFNCNNRLMIERDDKDDNDRKMY